MNDFDLFLEAGRKAMERERVMTFNPTRLAQWQNGCRALALLAEKSSAEAKITTELDDFLCMGTVSIETDDFTVTNVSKLLEALKDATTFEVYPLLNGNIRLSVSYNNVLKIIDVK